MEIGPFCEDRDEDDEEVEEEEEEEAGRADEVSSGWAVGEVAVLVLGLRGGRCLAASLTLFPGLLLADVGETSCGAEY